MKVYSTSGLAVPRVKRAFLLGAAALLAIGSMTAAAWDLGQGRGGPMDEPGRDWGYAPGPGSQSSGSFERFGDVGSPGLQRQSRFQGPGQHRVSGFSKAPSVGAGRYVHGPGAGGRGR